jgi:hypothetical protein
MRGSYIDIFGLALTKGGEYDSSDTKLLGWDHTFVLLMCLPVFFSFLAYAGILFYEVATKKEFISSKPITIITTTIDATKAGKYVETANPPTLGAQPTTGTVGTGADPKNAHLPVDPLNLNPTANPPVMATGVTTLPAIAVQKDTTSELYLWEELLIYMVFHIVGLTFCVQPAKRTRAHNACGVIIAWLHFALIIAYAFVSVSFIY